MRIGIITQPLQTNYGGLLQNYALQETLRRLGHYVVTLDQPYLRMIKKKDVCIQNIKGIVKKMIGLKVKPLRYIKESEIKQLAIHTSKFVDRYINHTAQIKRKDDFRKITKEFNLNALIVGSDQVWRPMYNPCITRMFFDFVQDVDIIRFSYAASFGVDTWEYSVEQTDVCKQLINKFTAVSVREKSGIDLCKEKLGVDATFVLDPTMLLDKDDYVKIVEESGIKTSPGNLFTYILDKNLDKDDIIEKVSSNLNLLPFSVMPTKSRLFAKENMEECVFPPVEQWLRAFMDAKFVICDSFHGAVFSIIFNKPFLIIGNEGRGMSRFKSLVELFSLEDRLITKSSDISVIEKDINWDLINEKRQKMKEKSIEYIANSLKDK